MPQLQLLKCQLTVQQLLKLLQLKLHLWEVQQVLNHVKAPLISAPSGPDGLPAQGMAGSEVSWVTLSEVATEDSFSVVNQDQDIKPEDL